MYIPEMWKLPATQDGFESEESQSLLHCGRDSQRHLLNELISTSTLNLVKTLPVSLYLIYTVPIYIEPYGVETSLIPGVSFKAIITMKLIWLRLKPLRESFHLDALAIKSRWYSNKAHGRAWCLFMNRPAKQCVRCLLIGIKDCQRRVTHVVEWAD